MVAELKSKGVSATAYHLIVKGSRPLIRDDVIDVVKTHGYDAVLVARVNIRQVDAGITTGTAEIEVTKTQRRTVEFISYVV